MQYDQQLEREIIEHLKNDGELSFKQVGNYLQQGKCPNCSNKDVFVSLNKPGRIACSHLDSCGWSETTRERYSQLFENLSERHPPTPEDPNATAKAYMGSKRGFPLVHINTWFNQGALPLGDGTTAATVRFELWDGFYWERIIDAKAIRVYGDKNHNKKGLKYANRHWAPPKFELEEGDRCHITEGIFHTIALTLSGYKSVAAFSSNNLPRDLIKENMGKGTTWVLAYDNDANKAGENAACKFRKELRDLGETVEIIQCPKGKDWDDIYRANAQDETGKAPALDDKFLDECKLRASINTAESLEDKAYWLYTNRNFSTRVIDFSNRLYSVSATNVASAVSKAIEDASQTDIEGHDKEELHKKSLEDAIKTNEGKKIFFNELKKVQIANFAPRFLFAQEDKVTTEVAYHIAIDFPGKTDEYTGRIKLGQTRNIAVTGSALENHTAFKKALLNQVPGAKFKGDAYNLESITDQWFNRGVMIVQTVPFIGYDKETGIYVYNEFGFYKGRFLKMTNAGYVSNDKHRIKSTLRSVELAFNKNFNGDWFNNFVTAFHYNGVCALAYFMGSLFAEQLRKRLGFFPFLEFTGDAGAGKSIQLEFFWKLVGRRDHEGFNPSKDTPAARARQFAQVSNLPVSLIEGDSRDGKDAKKGGFMFSELKDLFNGRGLRGRGMLNRGNDVDVQPFRGSVIITQNASVDGDEALLTRIVHLHATRAHQRPENKPLADWFRSVDVKEVCGFLFQALSKEDAIIDAIETHFRRLDKELAKDDNLKHGRIIECHALASAMVNALPLVLPKCDTTTVKQCEQHIHARALDRQRRLSADHPTVASFWEIYDLLNWRQVNDQPKGYKPASMAGLAPAPEYTETLNHSIKPELIAINLQEFNKACDSNRMERLDLTELRKLLPNSQKHTFVGFKSVRSKLANPLAVDDDSAADSKDKITTRWCAVFKNSEYTPE